MALNSKRRKELGLGKKTGNGRKKWNDIKLNTIPIPLEPVEPKVLPPFREVFEKLQGNPCGRFPWGMPRPLIRLR